MGVNNVPIVLYDGDCGFCNRSVAFVVKRDKTKTIHFAAIQSEFTKDLFEICCRYDLLIYSIFVIFSKARNRIISEHS